MRVTNVKYRLCIGRCERSDSGDTGKLVTNACAIDGCASIRSRRQCKLGSLSSYSGNKSSNPAASFRNAASRSDDFGSDPAGDVVRIHARLNVTIEYKVAGFVNEHVLDDVMVRDDFD